jgi:hypothetical protein
MASPRCKRARDGTSRTPEGGKNTEHTGVRQTCHTIWTGRDAPLRGSARPLRVIDVPYPTLSAFNPAGSAIAAGPEQQNFSPVHRDGVDRHHQGRPVPSGTAACRIAAGRAVCYQDRGGRPG